MMFPLDPFVEKRGRPDQKIIRKHGTPEPHLIKPWLSRWICNSSPVSCRFSDNLDKLFANVDPFCVVLFVSFD